MWSSSAPNGIAIIGSRTPPIEAADFAYHLAYRLGEPIVSGLSPGIDAAAHRGALDAGTKTIAFAAYGFGAPESDEQAALEARILAAGGVVERLVPPGTPASEASSIARDRLQAERARVVVLICSEPNGGAMHTLRFARELGKPRFAVMPAPESAGRPEWAGNVQAIATGATSLPFDIERALAMLR